MASFLDAYPLIRLELVSGETFVDLIEERADLARLGWARWSIFLRSGLATCSTPYSRHKNSLFEGATLYTLAGLLSCCPIALGALGIMACFARPLRGLFRGQLSVILGA